MAVADVPDAAGACYVVARSRGDVRSQHSLGAEAKARAVSPALSSGPTAHSELMAAGTCHPDQLRNKEARE